MGHMVALLVAMAVFVFGTPGTSDAWNIICGISISKKAVMAYNEIGKTKWDADARALRGISYYYLAVSELQRLDIRENTRISIPQSLSQANIPATEQASNIFLRSAREFKQALDIAEEYGLGDERGLGLLKKLHVEVSSFHDMLKSKKVLPELNKLQDTAMTIQAFTQHGIALSNVHLEHGLLGHGKGGTQYSDK